MTTKKTPAAGEWWRSRGGQIRYVICDLRLIRPDNDDPFPILSIDSTSDSESVISHMEDGREDSIDSENDLIEYLPACTGFDWKPPAETVRTIDVNPGDGYRWLDDDEIVAPTDEVFRPELSPCWVKPLTRAGKTVKYFDSDDYPVRRSIARTQPVEPPPAIDPGEGWELLPVGTVREKGDEFTRDRGRHWENTLTHGVTVDGSLAYRRRKPPAETWPKWYVHNDVKCQWFIKRSNERKSTIHRFFGEDGESTTYNWDLSDSASLANGVFIEVTEAEALARVKPAVTREEIAERTIERVKRFDPSEVKPAEPFHELCQMCCEPAIPGTGGCRECTQYAIEATGCPVERTATPLVTAAVEFHDDWVTQDRVPARPGIDDRRYHYSDGTTSDWDDSASIHWDRPVRHGDKIGATTSSYVELRCRRRDLPAWQPKTIDVSPGEGWRWVEKDEPWQEGDDCLICDFKHAHTHNCQCWRRRIVPQPKRTPVRLFVSADVRWEDRYIVSVKDGNPNPERHQEVKFDGSGFYVEGGE